MHSSTQLTPAQAISPLLAALTFVAAVSLSVQGAGSPRARRVPNASHRPRLAEVMASLSRTHFSVCGTDNNYMDLELR